MTLWNPAAGPPVDLHCPMCAAPLGDEFYGPCFACRRALNERAEAAGREMQVAAPAAPPAIEPPASRFAMPPSTVVDGTARCEWCKNPVPEGMDLHPCCRFWKAEGKTCPGCHKITLDR